MLKFEKFLLKGIAQFRKVSFNFRFYSNPKKNLLKLGTKNAEESIKSSFSSFRAGGAGCTGCAGCAGWSELAFLQMGTLPAKRAAGQDDVSSTKSPSN